MGSDTAQSLLLSLGDPGLRTLKVSFVEFSLVAEQWAGHKVDSLESSGARPRWPSDMVIVAGQLRDY